MDSDKKTPSAARPSRGSKPAAAKPKTAEKTGAKKKSSGKRAAMKRKQRRQKITRAAIIALALIASAAILAVLLNGDTPDDTGAPAISAATATAAPTPVPTDTPVPTPSPTPTEEPTPTPVPTDTPEPTPSPKPTPTPKPVKLDLPYLIDIDKTNQVLTVYTIGETGEYDLIVKQFICSTGHCDKVEDGMYKMGEKYRWKKMGNGSYAQYACRISGPYLIHSCCYYEQNPGKLKTRYYDNLGTNASSGCIRLAAGNAYWIYTNCPTGTPIRVHYSDAVDEELRESLKPVEMLNPNWDPTDPECREKYRVTPSPDTTPDPTPYPGVTPAPTPKWTVHPELKAWGDC